MSFNNSLRVITKNDIINTFKELGVVSGMVLEVCADLSTLDYLVGGAEVFVDALMETVGKDGTILMSLENEGNKEPSFQNNGTLSVADLSKIRNNLPAYNVNRNDIKDSNNVVANFRKREDIVYSAHPAYSFVSWGKHSKFLCNRQSLHFPLSEESPLARLYELRGSVLLVGVTYEKCSVMSLGEYRSDCRAIVLNGSAVEISNQRTWKKYLDIEHNKNDYQEIGRLMERMNKVNEVNINKCGFKLFKADDASSLLAEYLEKNKIYRLYHL
ncbi:MAG: aminoglycoside N(3)-acetyltransferase [Anaerorhabdus sp.]